MVALLCFTAQGYLAPLYERFAGQVMLVVGTACLVAAYLIDRRLMRKLPLTPLVALLRKIRFTGRVSSAIIPA